MIRRALLVVVPAAAAVVLAAAGSSRASALHFEAAFFTPERAAYCYLRGAFEYEDYFVPYLTCWTPNDGFTVTLTARGRPRSGYLTDNKWYQPIALRRLRFGQHWWGNTNGEQGTGLGRDQVLFRCASRATGLTCQTKAEHGFWLGRFRGYRLW